MKCLKYQDFIESRGEKGGRECQTEREKRTRVRVYDNKNRARLLPYKKCCMTYGRRREKKRGYFSENHRGGEK